MPNFHDRFTELEDMHSLFQDKVYSQREVYLTDDGYNIALAWQRSVLDIQQLESIRALYETSQTHPFNIPATLITINTGTSTDKDEVVNVLASSREWLLQTFAPAVYQYRQLSIIVLTNAPKINTIDLSTRTLHYIGVINILVF